MREINFGAGKTGAHHLKTKAERRRHLRHLAKERCSVSVQTVDIQDLPLTDKFEAVVTNISFGGLGVFITEKLAPNSIAMVHIEHAQFRGDIRMRVAWCHKGPSSGKVLSDKPRTFRVGLEFLPATREQEEFIKVVLENL